MDHSWRQVKKVSNERMVTQRGLAFIGILTVSCEDPEKEKWFGMMGRSLVTQRRSLYIHACSFLCTVDPMKVTNINTILLLQ